MHVALDDKGVRRITEVISVTGRVEGDVIETESIYTLTRDPVSGTTSYLAGFGQISRDRLINKAGAPV